MTTNTKCPVARPIGLPRRKRSTWMSAVSGATGARTVSPLFVHISLPAGVGPNQIGAPNLRSRVVSEVPDWLAGVSSATFPGVACPSASSQHLPFLPIQITTTARKGCMEGVGHE
jgi:hypothetical protein